MVYSSWMGMNKEDKDDKLFFCKMKNFAENSKLLKLRFNQVLNNIPFVYIMFLDNRHLVKNNNAFWSLKLCPRIDPLPYLITGLNVKCEYNFVTSVLEAYWTSHLIHFNLHCSSLSAYFLFPQNDTFFPDWYICISCPSLSHRSKFRVIIKRLSVKIMLLS